MSTGQQIQAQAVANELAGERKSATVSYPITGDPETDFISGVLVMAQSTPYSNPRSRMIARALAYLSTRFHDDAEAQEKQAEYLARMQPQYLPQNYGNQLAQAPNCYPSIGSSGVGISGSDIFGIGGSLT